MDADNSWNFHYHYDDENVADARRNRRRFASRPPIFGHGERDADASFCEAMKDPRRFRSLRYLEKSAKYIFVERNVGGLALLLVIFLAVNCISVATIEYKTGVVHEQVIKALDGSSLGGSVIPLILLARFSFGYLAGFSF